MSAVSGAGSGARARRRVIVFDVNETLLDVEALAPLFAASFGDGQVLREWFATVLHYSTVATLAGPYADFSAIAGAAIDMVAEARGLALAPEARARILTGIRALPAHPDVRPALDALRGHGFRLVALTNSAPAAMELQLKNAGLRDCFERAFSVDAVQRFKPAPEPYHHVAQQLGVGAADLRMVAAHAWDVAGAMRAGCAGAFVARPGKVWYPLAPKPDIVGADCRAVADAIVARDVD